jgi:hypothetical protein
MLHQGQVLALGLKASNNLPGVHPKFDDFQSHVALNRCSRCSAK